LERISPKEFAKRFCIWLEALGFQDFFIPKAPVA